MKKNLDRLIEDKKKKIGEDEAIEGEIEKTTKNINFLKEVLGKGLSNISESEKIKVKNMLYEHNGHRLRLLEKGLKEDRWYIKRFKIPEDERPSEADLQKIKEVALGKIGQTKELLSGIARESIWEVKIITDEIEKRIREKDDKDFIKFDPELKAMINRAEKLREIASRCPALQDSCNDLFSAPLHRFTRGRLLEIIENINSFYTYFQGREGQEEK